MSDLTRAICALTMLVGTCAPAGAAQAQQSPRYPAKPVRIVIPLGPGNSVELATRLVVLRQGQVVAEGDPAIVTGPGGDPFVRELIGARELVLRRLDLVRVGDVMQPTLELATGDFHSEASLQSEASLLDALTSLLELRQHTLRVRSSDGEAIGSISARTIIERHP